MAEVAIAEFIRLNSAETGPTEPPFPIEINSLKTRYMKTVVLLAPCIGSKARVGNIKNAIISYVGMRMVETVDQEFPGVPLNGELSDKDVEFIHNLAKEQDCVAAFITLTNEQAESSSNEFITCEFKDV